MSKAVPVLSVRGVTRTYDSAAGPLTVLKGVDLDVRPGEVVGLIGPSGSGKSSLLHAAGLLERPTSGEIRIDGRDVGDLPERARTHIRLASIGFVYQFHHLLAEFDALEHGQGAGGGGVGAGDAANGEHRALWVSPWITHSGGPPRDPFSPRATRAAGWPRRT